MTGAIPAGIVYLFVDDIHLPLRRKTTDKQALLALGRLRTRWEKYFPAATRTTLSDAEAFFRFMDQPRALRAVLRTSNHIERFNRELRRRLRSAGALLGEDALFHLIWFVSVEQDKRWPRRYCRTAKPASNQRPQQTLAA